MRELIFHERFSYPSELLIDLYTTHLITLLSVFLTLSYCFCFTLRFLCSTALFLFPQEGKIRGCWRE